MEKRVLFSLVVMLMFLVGSGFSQTPPPPVNAKKLAKSLRQAKWLNLKNKAKIPIILTLATSRKLCGDTCAILEDQVAQLAKTYGKQIIFYTADILENPFFAQLYNVVNVPTVIVFKAGIEIKRLEEDFRSLTISDLVLTTLEYFTPPPSNSSLPSPPPPGQ